MKKLIITSLFFVLIQTGYSYACSCASNHFCQSVASYTFSPVIVKGVILPNAQCDSVGTSVMGTIRAMKIKVLEFISGNETNDTLSITCPSIYWFDICGSNPFISGDTIVTILDSVYVGQNVYSTSYCTPHLLFKNDSVSGSIDQIAISKLSYSDFKNLSCIKQAQTVGYNEKEMSQPRMTVSPNPASTEVMVQIESINFELGKYTLQLIDLLGRKMDVEAVKSDNRLTIALTNIEVKPGIYFITFNSEGHSVSEKLIVTR